MRRRALFAAAVACLTWAAGAQAQSWPNRPVKIIVPFAAGGAADTLGRLIAEHLSSALHQQFYVENRGGAGGTTGAGAGACAPAGGHTVAAARPAPSGTSPGRSA